MRRGNPKRWYLLESELKKSCQIEEVISKKHPANLPKSYKEKYEGAGTAAFLLSSKYTSPILKNRFKGAYFIWSQNRHKCRLNINIPHTQSVRATSQCNQCTELTAWAGGWSVCPPWSVESTGRKPVSRQSSNHHYHHGPSTVCLPMHRRPAFQALRSTSRFSSKVGSLRLLRPAVRIAPS